MVKGSSFWHGNLPSVFLPFHWAKGMRFCHDLKICSYYHLMFSCIFIAKMYFYCKNHCSLVSLIGKRCHLLLCPCFPSLRKGRKHHSSEDSDLYQVALASSNLSDGQWGEGEQPPKRVLDPHLQRGPGERAHRGGGSSLRHWPGQDHRPQVSRAQGGSGEVLQRRWQGWKDHPEPTGE